MSIYEKLSAVQQTLKAPKDQFNDFGKYPYRSAEGILEAVKPILKVNSLSLILSDDIVEIGGRVYVKATATLLNAEGEHVCCSAFAREEETKKGMDSSQVTGAASSYARKYALNGLFCIDDNKDSDATNTQTKEITPKVSLKKEFEPVCADCGANITDREHDYSVGRYGRPLCRNCQRK